MATVVNQFKKGRRRRRNTPAQQRLDIQGLRMVAVLTVFAFHLCGWPKGGFVGVDVFFVISGFLITGNLLRMAEARGNVSFRRFYWNRVRRIVPAATVVLALTYLASLLVFLPIRSHQVGVDALWAFVFASNWWFAIQGTDYFSMGQAVSPIQHYWSLSIEEQFYFVWPALIFMIGLLVARRALTHGHRMQLAGIVMSAVVVLSLGWALYETSTSATWAYFNTFARVWELGVGALLATAVGALAKIPTRWKPRLSWTGLGLIVASLILITEHSAGFPAPWAILPVAGSGMVIAAGVGGEPEHLGLLRNRVSVYIGNISYSLYLVHWPIIVILGALISQHGPYFYLAVVAWCFALAVASYHFVENPLRYFDYSNTRKTLHEIRRRRYKPRWSPRPALAVLALSTVGLIAYTVIPPTHPYVPESAARTPTTAGFSSARVLPPRLAALQEEITTALKAEQWPQLDPPIESVITEDSYGAAPEVASCTNIAVQDQRCTWGDAKTRVVLIGDSDAMDYAGPLRDIALNSGKLQLRVDAMPGCPFIDVEIDNGIARQCKEHNQHVVDLITATKPDVVIIADSYVAPDLTTGGQLTPGDWSESMHRMVGRFRSATEQIVWLAPPPESKKLSECYTRASVPADCASVINGQWNSMAETERKLAETFGGVWIDSALWFCSQEQVCPAFVGSTLTKVDMAHMSLVYGKKITPVIEEALGGVF